MGIVQTVVVLIGLLVNSISDMKKKEIMIKFTVLYALIGVAVRMAEGFDGRDFFLSMLPGAVCLMLAFLTGEKIGYGDAWVLFATGCCMPSENLFAVCMIALAGIGMVALVLFVVLHKKGTFELPFVPFIFVGAVYVRCIGI